MHMNIRRPDEWSIRIVCENRPAGGENKRIFANARRTQNRLGCAMFHCTDVAIPEVADACPGQQIMMDVRKSDIPEEQYHQATHDGHRPCRAPTLCGTLLILTCTVWAVAVKNNSLRSSLGISCTSYSATSLATKG